MQIKRKKVEYPRRVIMRMLTDIGATYLGEGSYAKAFAVGDRVYKVGKLHENTAYLAYVRQVVKASADNPLLPKIYSATIYEDTSFEANSYMLVEMERLEEHTNRTGEIGELRRRIRCNVFVNTHEAEVSAVIHRAFKNARRKDDTAVLDMHIGNFMLRGEQIVVTDPIA